MIVGGRQWRVDRDKENRTAGCSTAALERTVTRKLDSYTCENVNFVLVFWGSELAVSVMRTLMDDTA